MPLPSKSKSGASRAQQRLRIAGVLVLVGGLMVAVFLAVYVGALSVTVPVGVDQSYRVVNMNQQPTKLASGQAVAFNWYIFLFTSAPAVISSAILFSGAEICGAVARRTRTRSSSSSSSGDETIALGD